MKTNIMFCSTKLGERSLQIKMLEYCKGNQRKSSKIFWMKIQSRQQKSLKIKMLRHILRN